MRKIITFVLCTLSLYTLSAAPRRVHTIGDSTMSDYKPAATPKRGWGMYLQVFFNQDSIEVNNRGKSGASTRTFYETENLWPSVKRQMKAGDYLIIQFAHNDEKCKGEDVYVQNAKLRAEGKDTLTDMRGTEPNTTYKQYLRKFINEAREMGVKPILMSPICRAYFKDGKINEEGRHNLTSERMNELKNEGDKDYVRCMREVAEEMQVPFLDMTERTREMYESEGQEICMKRYFNCGDKTHTGQEGGMLNAHLAYLLIKNSPELAELHHLVALPPIEVSVAYIRGIEEKGRREAFNAQGMPYKTTIKNAKMHNMQLSRDRYMPLGGVWPAGEIDEVANRYIEYTITAEKKKGLVIESIYLPVKAIGGPGMNIHINYGFGDEFRNVTTIYENTALPKNQEISVSLNYPILVPAGQTIHIRILPWYDSNGKGQSGKFLQLGAMKITGKKLL